MSPESWATTIAGGFAIFGAFVHYTRIAFRALRDLIETITSLRDLTQEFVKMVAEDERRFNRIEEHLNLPPWRG